MVYRRYHEWGGSEVINSYALILLATLVGVGIATFFRSYLFTVAGERIVMQLQGRLFESLMRQDIAFSTRIERASSPIDLRQTPLCFKKLSRSIFPWVCVF